MRTMCMMAAGMALAACNGAQDASVPGNTEDTQAYAGIAEDDVIRFTGTEPFWGGTIRDDELTYSTPENIDGVMVQVSRFAGRGGLSFSGAMDGQRFDLAITPAECSDGMSDRTYPFAATLQLGSQQRTGCAWLEGDDLGEP